MQRAGKIIEEREGYLDHECSDELGGLVVKQVAAADRGAIGEGWDHLCAPQIWGQVPQADADVEVVHFPWTSAAVQHWWLE